MKFFQLIILVCLASFAFALDIVDEDFEGGATPAGWQIWEYGDEFAIEWEVCYVGQYTYMPDPAHSGTHYAWHDDGVSSSPLSDSWLVTDTYDFSYIASVNVNFWRYLKYASYYDYTGFWYSTVASPTFSDFTELLDLTNLDPDLWMEFNIDVTTECSGEQYVTFAWVYAGAWAHAEAIDDVLITGEVALERDTWGSIKSTF